MRHNVNAGVAELDRPLASDRAAKAASVSRVKFVGTWGLSALGGEGLLVERLGPNPLGLLIYDRSGNMSVQIMKREHDDIPLKTDRDFKVAFQSYVGYFGKYSVQPEERTITHHVYGSLYPRDVGRDFKRLYEFSGNNLILTATGIIGGEHIAAQLIWERALSL